MKPTRDIVLIRADEPRKQTESGLFLNEDWKTLPLNGEVLAVGPLVTNVEVGDRVVFERYASVILENNERLCKSSHIFGVFNG